MNSTNTVGKLYSPVGAMFMKVGGTEGTWRLGDIKPKDGSLDYMSEYLQEFDSQTGAIGQKYIYVDKTQITEKPFKSWTDPSKCVGWWKQCEFTKEDPDMSLKADNVEFKAGQGLYSNFSGAKAKLDFSGEVVCEEWQLDLTGKTYAPIINYLARPITLGEIIPEDGALDYMSEYIQEFDPLTGAIGQKYIYVDKTQITEKPFKSWTDPSKCVGWWKLCEFTKEDPDMSLKADDIIIQPGAGFYSNFGGAKAKLNFPSSIPAAK